jgi:hypothetical protein
MREIPPVVMPYAIEFAIRTGYVKPDVLEAVEQTLRGKQS